MSGIHRKSRITVAALCSLIGSASTTVVSADYRDSLMQPPTLGAPGRGSVAGTVGDLSYDAAEMSRGSRSVATPITAPGERGALLASVTPTYSPEGGQSEW